MLYPKSLYQKGLEIITVPTVRNLPEAVNPSIKSLNYLNNIMAKIEAKNGRRDQRKWKEEAVHERAPRRLVRWRKIGAAQRGAMRGERVLLAVEHPAPRDRHLCCAAWAVRHHAVRDVAQNGPETAQFFGYPTSTYVRSGP